MHNCTITNHEITDDGSGCECGYLAKANQNQVVLDELYRLGNNFIPSGQTDGSKLGDYLESRIAFYKPKEEQ